MRVSTINRSKFGADGIRIGYAQSEKLEHISALALTIYTHTYIYNETYSKICTCPSLEFGPPESGLRQPRSPRLKNVE